MATGKMNLPIPKEEESLVRTSNSLALASYRISTNAKRFITVLASKVNKNDPPNKEYEVTRREIRDLMGGKKCTAFYENFEEIIKELFDTPVIVEKGDKIYECRWLSARVYDLKNESKLAFSFHPSLQDDLFNLKNFFNQYYTEQLIRLPVFNSQRLYEALHVYAYIGHCEFTVEQLRAIFALEQDTYPEYANFKQRILSKAIDDINEHTTLKVTFKEKRAGRKVKWVRFWITETKPIIPRRIQIKEDITEKDYIEPIVKILVYYGVDEKEAAKIAANYDIRRIMRNLDKYKKDEGTGIPIDNPGGYIHWCIQTDKATEEQLSLWRQDKDKALQEKTKEQFRVGFVLTQAVEEAAATSEEVQTIEETLEEISDPMLKEIFLRGLQNAGIIKN